MCSGRCSARPDTSCTHSTESRQVQANGAAMWRCAIISGGIRPGAGAWSLTSASPMTGLGRPATCSLSHPQDLDAPLRIAAQRCQRIVADRQLSKIAAYQQQYADNQNISFRPAIVRERECCLLVLNLVSSTLSCIRQPRPRLRVLDVCGFV